MLLGIVGMAFEYPHFGEEQREHPRRGLDNRKLGIWAFIGSESVFFASLISTYLIYKGHNLSGPTAPDILEIPLTSVSTFVLLMSSLSMVLALAASQRGDVRWCRRWLLGTAGLGLMFLLGQVYEFTHFYHEGLALQTNLFSQTFFTLVGFHGAHVTVGVVWLLAWRSPRSPGTFRAPQPLRRAVRPLLALRRRRVDRDLHARLPARGSERRMNEQAHAHPGTGTST